MGLSLLSMKVLLNIPRRSLYCLILEDPEIVHGKTLIFLNDNFNITEINRISTIVKKEGVLAVLSNESKEIIHEGEKEKITFIKISRIKL